MKARALAAFLLITVVASGTRAESSDLGTAKASFNAGAIAYAAGDYLAAIQALDAAYQLTPLPAIAFSLAQAERRQYFVSHEASHLERACELYRRYLAEVPVGGRRADATDALAQLEPLAASRGAASAAPSAEPAEAPKTRLMVSSPAPSALVSLDQARAVPAPLIAEVAPGPHQVRVYADGFVASERSVVAVSGALVPLEVALEEVPAKVLLDAPKGADFYVDGRLQGKVGTHTELTLPSGRHSFTFAMNGHQITTLDAALARGESRTLYPTFKPTPQRTLSFVLFGVGGAALVSGITFGALALGQESKANDLLDQREVTNISPSERDDYEEAVRRRDQFRVVAAVGLTTSVVSFVAGLALHQFDEPSVREELPERGRGSRRRAPQLALVAPSAGEGLALSASF
jgi:hypothetical protein